MACFLSAIFLFGIRVVSFFDVCFYISQIFDFIEGFERRTEVYGKRTEEYGSVRNIFFFGGGSAPH